MAVVTGQQAGLFGGPLFTLLKALTAIKLAEQVARDHSVPAVAVFWIDAEDHDWEEVRSCTVFDEARAAQAVVAPPPDGAGPAPGGPADARRSHQSASIEIRTSCLPDTEFRDALIEQPAARLRARRRHGRRVRPLAEEVLGDRGLVVYDSSDRRRSRWSRAGVRRELSTMPDARPWPRWPAPI